MTRKDDGILVSIFYYMVRLLAILIGSGMSVSGAVSCIGYLNMLTTGHTFLEFGKFIIGRPELYIIPIGMIIVILSLLDRISSSSK
ncbi:hypothetical protein [Peribacillus alkalitolerans]|uniref:hypothetical protein n=1 Tax=Peribacillus alkalitolerans TaxID=1550385 RepID=UPI001F07BBEB|nr:hypothetical protein [Peribacillus alkalitolerans]